MRRVFAENQRFEWSLCDCGVSGAADCGGVLDIVRRTLIDSCAGGSFAQFAMASRLSDGVEYRGADDAWNSHAGSLLRSSS
ncbi:hypothetical protein BURKHO8Y_30100 [Burkholderia sp. 8Y]|nr:hypothetical protein BURKHO8Y_30100 [Burkholderia sp. 8Y]